MTNAIASQMEDELHEHGGLAAIERLIAHPVWSEWDALHDWRCHVPVSVQAAWGSLSFESRLVAYLMAVRGESWG
jgi:hypothetical protein